MLISMPRIVLCILCLFLFSSLKAQLKIEKEIRIKKEDVPEEAIKFVASMPITSSIKWFKELGQGKISYEAKSKYRGQQLSIEFNDLGTFEDLEIKIHAKEIDPLSMDKISSHLAQEYGKFKIDKVQKQYLGNPDAIKQLDLKDEQEKGLEINYELVVSTKMNDAFALFEYLFDQRGNFIKKSRISSQMTDNLEF